MQPDIVVQRLRPTDLHVPISALEEAIATMERWGVRVPDLGRLRAHLKTLRGVQDAGEYPLESEPRQRVANAIRDASDFAAIAFALGPGRIEPVLSELKNVLAGTQHQTERERGPYQFQSQFFYGAIMSAAGAHLRCGRGPGRYPDFVVQNGSREHGIEIKRPESADGVERGLRSAAAQLTAVDGGMVVTDLSDVLQSDLVVPVQHGDGFAAWHAETDSRFCACVRRVRELVARRSFSNASRVLSVGFFARGWLWHEVGSPGSAALPEFHSRFYVETLGHPAGTLWWHRGEFLSNTFEAGLYSLIPQVYRVAADW